MKTVIIATLRFEGFHSWGDAPSEVGFLRARHRHMFHVRAEKEVTHDNRQIEFILLKRELEQGINVIQFKERDACETWSCEMWAKRLLQDFKLSACEVSEDGENGARVEA